MVLKRLRAAALAALACAAFAAHAHRGEAQRSLRLQIVDGRVEGLLEYKLPPGLLAQKLLAVPRGLVPGEGAGRSAEEVLGRRLAAEALRGLRVSVGPEQSPLRDVPLRIVEAKARPTQTKGIEALFLLRLDDALVLPAVLQLACEAGPRVKALVVGQAGLSLAVLSGVGRQVEGGVNVRPRPRAPVQVLIGRPQPIQR